MQDKRDLLYDRLIKTGKVKQSEIGTREQFKNALVDEASAKKLHNNLRSRFSDREIGNEDDFYNFVAPDFAKQESAQVENVQTQTATPVVNQQSGQQQTGGRQATTSNGGAGKTYTSAFGNAITNRMDLYKEARQAERENLYKLQPPTLKPQDIPSDYQLWVEDEQAREKLRDTYQQVPHNTGGPIVQQSLREYEQYKGQRQKYNEALKYYDAQASDAVSRLTGTYGDTEGDIVRKYVDAYQNIPQGQQALSDTKKKIEDRYAQLNKEVEEALPNNPEYQKIKQDLQSGAITQEEAQRRYNKMVEGLDVYQKAQEDIESYQNEYAEQAATYFGRYIDRETKPFQRKAAKEVLAESKKKKEAGELSGVAENLVNKTEKLINAVEDAGGVVGNVSQGIWDQLTDWSTWSLGIADAYRASKINDLQEKVMKAANGENIKLSDEEKNFLDVYANYVYVMSLYQKDLPLSYKAGQTTGEAIPFIAQILLGGGLTKAATAGLSKAVGKTTATRIAKAAANLAGKNAFTRGVASGLGYGKYTGGFKNTLGYLTGAHLKGFGYAGTVGLPTTLKMSQELQTGEAKIETDDKGRPTIVGFENQLGQTEAALRALLDTGIEFTSENVGTVFDRYLPDFTPKMFKNQKVKDFMTSIQRGSLIGEYLEEKFGELERIPFGLSSVEDFISAEQNIETFVSLIPMQVMFGAAGGVGYAVDKARINKFEKSLPEEYRDLWYEATKDIDIQTKNEFMANVRRIMYDPTIEEDKKVEAVKMMIEKRKEAFAQEKIDGDIENNAEAGQVAAGQYDVETGEGADAVSAIISDYNREYDYMSSKNYNPETLSATDALVDPDVLDFLNAKARYMAAMTTVQENVDNKVAGFAEMQKGALYHDGRYVQGTDINNNNITVLSGELSEKEGLWSASGSVVIRNLATGEVSMVDGTMIKIDTVENDGAAVAQRMVDNYRNILEQQVGERISPVEEVQEQQEKQEEKKSETKEPVQQKQKEKLYEGNRAVVVSEEDGITYADIYDSNGRSFDTLAMPTEEFDKLDDYVTPSEAVVSQPEQKKEEVATDREQQVVSEQQPTIPTDKDGNIIYDKISVEDTIADIYNDPDLTEEEADAFVEENIKAAQKNVSAINKKAPTIGTNKAKYKADKAKWQETLNEAKRVADYWENVKQTRKVMKTTDADVTYQEMMKLGEPIDKYEQVAFFLTGIKLLRDSYMKETGFGNKEANKMIGMFASAEKGGVSIERASEILSEMGDNPFFTPENQMEARDIIIEVLQEVETRGDLYEYVRRRRKEAAERERKAEMEALEAKIQDEYGMSLAEYEAYEEQILQEIKAMSETNYSELMDIVANEIETYYKSKEDGSTTTETTSETSGEVLQGEQSTDGGRLETTDGEIGGQSNNEDAVTQEDAIRQAESEVNTTPTDAQKEAGNYKKGHIRIDGYDITIEQPKGSVRSGVDENGNKWETTMNNTYGYIRGTQSVDGDHIDVFLSDNPTEGNVYVVDQINQETGEWDEHKILYGFGSMEEAKAAYLSNYSEGWKIGNVTEVSKEEFKKWINSSKHKTKPFSEYASVKPIEQSVNGDTIKTTEKTGENEGAPSGGESKVSKLEQKEQLPISATREQSGLEFVERAFPTREGQRPINVQSAESENGKITITRAEYEDGYVMVVTAGNNEKDLDFVAQQYDKEGNKIGAEKFDVSTNAQDLMKYVEFDAMGNMYEKGSALNQIADKYAEIPQRKEGENILDYAERVAQAEEERIKSDKLPKALIDAYQSGNEERINSVRKQMQEYVNSSGDADVLQTTLDKAKENIKAAKKEKDDARQKMNEDVVSFVKARLKELSNKGIKPKAKEEQKPELINENKNELDDLEGEMLEAGADYAAAVEENKDVEEVKDKYRKAFEAYWNKAGLSKEDIESKWNDELTNYGNINQIPEQQESPTEKIEDVGEKIGGAKKDKVKEYSEKIKEIEGDSSDLISDIAKLPLSKIYNFDYKALREEGVSNEIISLLETIKKFIPSKPRTEYKLRRWANNVFSLYSMALRLIASDGTTQQKWVDKILSIEDLKRKYNAYMALGGFDANVNTADAMLLELDDSAGHYDKKGNWISSKGKWYLSNAGKYSGIYDTFEQAKEALQSFAGVNAEEKKQGKPIQFSIYKLLKDGSFFITPKSNSNVIIETFDNVEAARKYLKENYNDLVEKYKSIKESSKIGFLENQPRQGRDWRKGKNISADEFKNTFGFRGVEFGNWANQQDRQIALNSAYDAFMDLASAIGKSPKAISLNGELAMAFGARGGGKAMAHYEPSKIVINLTKTQGAGSLAHEWFHAIDNYFARQRGYKGGYNTEGTGYKFEYRGDISSRKPYRTSDKERQELTESFDALVKAINNSEYGKRSSAYSHLVQSKYWREPTELGARAFAKWIEIKLAQNDTRNDFLANNPSGWSSLEQTEKYYPYPFESDMESIGEAFDNLFNTIQEKVDEQGNSLLYRFIGERGAANLDAAEEVTTRLDNLQTARDMEQSGKDAKTIKLATGWERGADGLWRYETMDIEYYPNGDARKNSILENRSWNTEYQTLLDKLVEGETMTEEEQKRFNELDDMAQGIREQYDNTEKIYLDDYVKDDELFKAYPELKQTRVVFVDNNKGGAGSYSVKDNSITININSDINTKSVLAHEIQHAIQRIEGFATGGNYKSVLLFLEDNPDVEIKLVVDETYKEAKNRGIDITKDELYKMFTESDDVAQEIENEIILRNNITEAELGETYNSGVDAGYRSIAGEVEARNVQKRLGMSMDERLNTLAEETEDVAREDQIILQDMAGKAMSVQEPTTQRKEQISSAATELANKLNTPIRIVNSLDELTEAERTAVEAEHRRGAERGERRRVAGWFNPRTGEVVLFMPDVKDEEDARKTILHEIAGHKGMRELIGEEYDNFLFEVYANGNKSVRQAISERMMRNGWDVNLAVDEYLAEMAETEPGNITFWDKVMNAFRKMLRKVGINVKVSNRELRYLLKQSYNNRVNSGVFKDAQRASDEYVMRTGRFSDMTAEEEDIIDRAKADGTYMFAPNGQPTNLTEKQWAQVRTKAFKDWFGDWENDPENASKVVDENGEPLAVYHGTTKGGFSEFYIKPGYGKGAYFTNEKRFAEEYANDSRLNVKGFTDFDTAEEAVDYLKKIGIKASIKRDKYSDDITLKIGRLEETFDYEEDLVDYVSNEYGEYSGVYETFLSLKSPLIIDANGSQWNNIEVLNGTWTTDSLTKYAIQNDYEGLIVKNVSDRKNDGTGLMNDYIVFSPSQIKSATDNIGTFSAENEDIRYRIEAQNEVYDLLKIASKDIYVKQAGTGTLYATYKGETVRIADHEPNYSIHSRDTHKNFYTMTVEGKQNDLFDVVDDVLDYFGINGSEEYEKLRSENSKRRSELNKAGIETEALLKKYVEERQKRMAEIAGLISGREDEVRKMREDAFNEAMKLNPKAAKRRKHQARIFDEMFEKTFGKIYPREEIYFVIDHPVRFRSIPENNAPEQGIAQQSYEDAVSKTFGHRFSEAWVDTMRPVKKAQEAIEKEKGEKLKDSENYYWQQDVAKGKNRVEIEEYQRQYVNPILDVLARLTKKGYRLRDVEGYLNSVHGLERNEVMYQRQLDEIRRKNQEEYEREKELAEKQGNPIPEEPSFEPTDKQKEKARRDYSGLTSIYEVDDVNEAEELAREYIQGFEENVGEAEVNELWKLINRATNFALDKEYKSGFLTKEAYEQIKDMYDNYVPLRGFDETTAADVYDYVNNNNYVFDRVARKAEGRFSRAADIISHIFNMGNSAIIRGNNNVAKQALVNLAVGKKTSLLTVGKVWYAKGTDGKFYEVEIPDTSKMSPEEAERTIDEFETEMREKAKNGEAFLKRPKMDIGLRRTKSEEQQHIVRVYKNGREMLVHVNGNPAFALAVNGANSRGHFNWNMVQRFNRWRASILTSWNLEFLQTNFLRDIPDSANTSYIKYGIGYARKFIGNVFSLIPALGRFVPSSSTSNVNISSLYNKFQKGQLDMNNKVERYFDEFMRNGGEIGFIQALSVDEYNKIINKRIKQYRGLAKAAKAAATGASVFLELIERLNRKVENICRFAAYMTSRDAGKTVLESSIDSKEVSVNFNRTGSGAMGNSATKHLFLFINPAIQSLAKYAGLAKKYPKRFAISLGFHLALGIGISLINALLTGGDDDDYYNLGAYTRRNNMCVYLGNGKYYTWPLPHEIKAIYGLGEIITGAMLSRDTYENKAVAITTQLSYLFPIDFINADGFVRYDESLIDGIVKGVTPDIVKPFFEAYYWNENFMGNPITLQNQYNEAYPEWRRSPKSTSNTFIDLSKGLTALSGDGIYRRSQHDSKYSNPAAIEHILESYGGGPVRFINGVIKSVESVWDEDKRSPQSYPFVRSVIKSTNADYNRSRHIKNQYSVYKAEAEIINAELNGLKTESDIEYKRERIAVMRENGELRKAERIKDAESSLKKLNDIIKTTTDRQKLDDLYKKKEEVMERTVNMLNSEQ